MRLFYAAGPGDVVGTFHHWQRGAHDPTQVAMTYSGQFYSLCEEINAHAYVASSCARKETVQTERFIVSNVPALILGKGWIGFALEQLRRGIAITARALACRADVVVVTGDISFWFIFSLLACMGIKIIPSLHCVLWSQSLGPNRMQRLTNILNSTFFKRHAYAILTVSDDINLQISTVSAYPASRIVRFSPTYEEATFASVPPADHDCKPFVVLYCGRIETDKGVFDLLEVASILRKRKTFRFRFEVCGDGSDLEKLRNEVKLKHLTEIFLTPGYCDREEILHRLGTSHVIVSPTRSSFVEGFNKSIAEGVLAGRPVITSRVCPALQYVKDAALEVQADSPESYANAIEMLASNRDLYNALSSNCKKLQKQFYSMENSWKNRLAGLIRCASKNKKYITSNL